MAAVRIGKGIVDISQVVESKRKSVKRVVWKDTEGKYITYRGHRFSVRREEKPAASKPYYVAVADGEVIHDASLAEVSVYSLRRVKEDSVVYDFGSAGSIRTPAEAYAFLRDVLNMDTLTNEHFVVVSLDTKSKAVGLNVPFVGSLNASIVHPREVFQAALMNNAAAILVAHNHPSGDPTPSREDKDVTRRLVEAGKIMGIQVMDHIITGENGRYLSMAEKGLI